MRFRDGGVNWNGSRWGEYMIPRPTSAHAAGHVGEADASRARRRKAAKSAKRARRASR